MIEALGWPRGRKRELATLLAAIRAQLLAALNDRRPLIAYADKAAQLGLLQDALDRLVQLDSLVIHTEAREALRVAAVQAGLAEKEAHAIEARYHENLVRELEWHNFRGIAQLKRTPRLPLANIYIELSLLSSQDETERRRA